MDGQQNLKINTKRYHPVIDEDLDKDCVFEIHEGIKHKKIINKFQDWLISMVNKLEAEDGMSETRNMNTRYKYSMN